MCVSRDIIVLCRAVNSGCWRHQIKRPPDTVKWTVWTRCQRSSLSCCGSSGRPVMAHTFKRFPSIGPYGLHLSTLHMKIGNGMWNVREQHCIQRPNVMLTSRAHLTTSRSNNQRTNVSTHTHTHTHEPASLYGQQVRGCPPLSYCDHQQSSATR